MSLSEVCAFYSKENIFYILLTVDFFVVNIFCIFIYKSHKKNSNVQLYTLNLQLEENKVNSVVSGSKCPPSFLFFCLGVLGVGEHRRGTETAVGRGKRAPRSPSLRCLFQAAFTGTPRP